MIVHWLREFFWQALLDTMLFAVWCLVALRWLFMQMASRTRRMGREWQRARSVRDCGAEQETRFNA